MNKADEVIMDELLAEVLEILKGIETEELLDDKAWWETSLGAEFGRERIVLIKEAFARTRVKNE
jgi:hypothetical protein